jgi:hypothetical protein
MDIIWSLLGVVLITWFVSAFIARGARRRGQRALARMGGPQARPEGKGPGRSEVDLWPDRTGPQTRRELGARHATDVTFAGDRIEHKHERKATAAAIAKAKGEAQAAPGRHEHGPGTNPAADLAPEDEFGEDRPAARTTAPDAPPTQWHPKDHGVPGDHIRDGHHRSATAPERNSSATDPYAHAPVPGPNHIPPEGGVDFPPHVSP